MLFSSEIRLRGVRKAQKATEYPLQVSRKGETLSTKPCPTFSPTQPQEQGEQRGMYWPALDLLSNENHLQSQPKGSCTLLQHKAGKRNHIAYSSPGMLWDISSMNREFSGTTK